MTYYITHYYITIILTILSVIGPESSLLLSWVASKSSGACPGLGPGEGEEKMAQDHRTTHLPSTAVHGPRREMSVTVCTILADALDADPDAV